MASQGRRWPFTESSVWRLNVTQTRIRRSKDPNYHHHWCEDCMRVRGCYNPACNYRKGGKGFHKLCRRHKPRDASQMKRCRKCGKEKPLREFCYVRDSTGRSYPHYCRPCDRKRHRVLGKRFRKQKTAKDMRWRKENREMFVVRKRARERLRRAIVSGDIIRPKKCEKCGSRPQVLQDGRPAIHGHHHKGYDKWMEVMWLCPPCHSQEHS